MQDTVSNTEIAMEVAELTREDVFTDNRIGTIRQLTPVTEDGETDTSREVRYLGSTQIMTPAGALPLSFEIPAASLKEAVAGFGEAAQEAVEQTMSELKELQRQAASSIVVPKGGVDPSAMGGGKIQLP
ncbi:MAG: hypothetical protein R3348_04980 [Xanthomonadales bacterium]|nr:hypothetical protein [Xanthomonadales bacterium]